ncbi:MAG: hypothetical protein ABI221_03225 [Candidatus Saccharimonadales bacterium]
MNQRRQSNSLKSLLSLVVIGLLAVAIYWQRWNIYDWAKLYNYQPPAPIAQLADQTTMTSYGRHLFYVYHPELQDSASFNRNCHVTKAAIVLGCTVNLRGIYLYKVNDTQLNGIEQVTAAYEMLHVGYSRLSASERQHIDQLVLQEFNSIKVSQPQLATEAQSYLDTEGQAALPNELHSMMGTEVDHLPPELEQYYARYFSNRQAIIQYKNQYQGVFTSRQATVTSDDQQLTATQKIISSNESNLSNQAQAITTQRAQLEQWRSSNQVDTYNNTVPAFNQSINSYNQLADQTQQLINDYNQLLGQRNALALEINQLTQKISSQPITNLKTNLAPQ